jgi:hypothetical protein
MKEITDISIKKEIVEKRKFYQPGVDKEGWSYVGAFILKQGKATIIDSSVPPGAPKTYVDL